MDEEEEAEGEEEEVAPPEHGQPIKKKDRVQPWGIPCRPAPRRETAAVGHGPSPAVHEPFWSRPVAPHRRARLRNLVSNLVFTSLNLA